MHDGSIKSASGIWFNLSCCEPNPSVAQFHHIPPSTLTSTNTTTPLHLEYLRSYHTDSHHNGDPHQNNRRNRRHLRPRKPALFRFFPEVSLTLPDREDGGKRKKEESNITQQGFELVKQLLLTGLPASHPGTPSSVGSLPSPSRLSPPHPRGTINTYHTTRARRIGTDSQSGADKQQQRFNLILGARDVPGARAAFDALGYDTARHRLTVLPLELSDLRATQAFAARVVALLRSQPDSSSSSSPDDSASSGSGSGSGVLDYLLLNAGITGGGGAVEAGGLGAWSEAAVVNHFCEFCVVICNPPPAFLLDPHPTTTPATRVFWVPLLGETGVLMRRWCSAALSGALVAGEPGSVQGEGGGCLLWGGTARDGYRFVLLLVSCASSRAGPPGPLLMRVYLASLERDLRAGSGVDSQMLYSQTKFVQLLGAHWWRRQLAGKCAVVAVSPGLIPGTGLGRGSGMKLSMDMPDAKPVPEGGLPSYPSLFSIILTDVR